MDLCEISDKTVHEILTDMLDRGGFSNLWDEIDEEIQKEIKTTWKYIILNNMKEGGIDGNDA